MGVAVEIPKATEPELREVAIDSVVVHAERFRPLGDLGALVESIREVGLTNPVKLNAGLELLNGRHRLEACRQLGWGAIRAFVYDVDQLRQELIGIDDDLVRKELTPLERGERMARKKEIYETLYPDARPKVVAARASHRAQGRGDARATVARASFVSDTVEKTGLSRRTIQEEIQIANGISPDVKARIHGTRRRKGAFACTCSSRKQHGRRSG